MQPTPYEHGSPPADIDPSDWQGQEAEAASRYDAAQSAYHFHNADPATAAVHDMVVALQRELDSLRVRLYGTDDVQPSQGDVEVIRRDVEALAQSVGSLSALDPAAYQSLTPEQRRRRWLWTQDEESAHRAGIDLAGGLSRYGSAKEETDELRERLAHLEGRVEAGEAWARRQDAIQNGGEDTINTDWSEADEAAYQASVIGQSEHMDRALGMRP